MIDYISNSLTNGKKFPSRLCFNLALWSSKIAKTSSLYLFLTITLSSQSKRKLPHPPKHDDDSPTDNHKAGICYQAYNLLHEEKHVSKPDRYNEIRSRDSPFGSSGRRLSDNFHRKLCCEQPRVILLSSGQFVPRLLGRQGHFLCLFGSSHESWYSSSNNNSVRAG